MRGKGGGATMLRHRCVWWWLSLSSMSMQDAVKMRTRMWAIAGRDVSRDESQWKLIIDINCGPWHGGRERRSVRGYEDHV
jgi:hypothetical protein